ncbi:hypothetical protein OG921_22130 [Aldersonia sp. NBC_00410]|uniref:hypothetical protein n=1 Tax=Aldersonia sp. NBC_00410 TaxID=2975954 RepID=UPI00225470C7|nr:hypothetical protein [Aldersonia sp. NBC_00410]MCX5045871.1 hypothetical protein [Aldersonia sp. NBC_00410]
MGTEHGDAAERDSDGSSSEGTSPGASRSDRAGRSDWTHEFLIEDATAGPFAHGFGIAADRRPFAFQVVRATMTVELYREDLPADVVPDRTDIVATAQAPVTDIDLDDVRSIVALVRDMISAAVPERPDTAETTIVRALLGRMSW